MVRHLSPFGGVGEGRVCAFRECENFPAISEAFIFIFEMINFLAAFFGQFALLANLNWGGVFFFFFFFLQNFN